MIEQLLNLLLSGKLKLGDRLPPETELATQVGIGRNSVREAMKVLQVLGIIERRQGDGSYIASNFNLPFDSLLFTLLGKIGTSNDLVELRRVLEIGVMELVIEKADENDFRVLREKLAEFERTTQLEPQQVERCVKADLSLHLAMIEVTGNSALLELGKLIMRLFENSMLDHLASPQGLRRAVEDHRSILDAVMDRDRERARSAIIASYMVWKEFIQPPVVQV